MEQFMEEARMMAAQCWCDEENKKTVMDPALAESFARRLAAWMDTAAFFSRNEEFYRGWWIAAPRLLDRRRTRPMTARFTTLPSG